MIEIGPYQLNSRAVLAPMAGITDQPFRRLCRQYGAALAPTEMVTSNSKLWDSDKNRLRLRHQGESQPVSVQIAGSDPQMMAHAARHNVAQGAQIIDINMGCPAKKVLKKAAGSALLKDERLVESILTAVVAAVDVPVTLKIRTGWSPQNRNGVRIARIAEAAGIKALAVHGRTRECMFRGQAEYDTIGEIKEAVAIPIFANGDIISALKAKYVIDYTKCDGVMIGRAARGKPWLFRDINYFLNTGKSLEALDLFEVYRTLLIHIKELHQFYGDYKGVLISRKHVAWYLQDYDGFKAMKARFNSLQNPAEQINAINQFFSGLIDTHKQELVA